MHPLTQYGRWPLNLDCSLVGRHLRLGTCSLQSQIKYHRLTSSDPQPRYSLEGHHAQRPFIPEGRPYYRTEIQKKSNYSQYNHVTLPRGNGSVTGPNDEGDRTAPNAICHHEE